ncbi:metallophosphoesterase [Altericroceibacterium spongiae]|uniref:Metallophosphoesterase n=1 Tax=Altericroceibacterium spongiae TaxID=2320269 RepID=A0A420EEB9_9SPHN|nr:metallophosphoesterase [Altericroceibacterium spongiae]RKF19027.1 metallophosphoesterase [Altericroceibacterium spongiae]
MIKSTHLFHISDIHFGLEDNRALDWVRQEIAAHRPDAVAITGDLTMRARHREFNAACHWIRSLDVPVTVEVGNHDLPYFNLLERFLTPYKRFHAIQELVEREIDLPDLAIIPLKTTARAQPRLNWSKGWVGKAALERCLKAIDHLPDTTRALVAVHHPLVEVGTHGTALTHGGQKALTELARRNVLAVLSGHVHDAFDLTHDTECGPVRMIGAGTLSQRIRSTPQSFNEIRWDGETLDVIVRNIDDIDSRQMMIRDVPDDATPPRDPEDPVAPIGTVPRTDPPIH